MSTTATFVVRPMCSAMVHNIPWVAERFPCSRVATTEISGDWFCTQHAKKRRKKRP